MNKKKEIIKLIAELSERLTAVENEIVQLENEIKQNNNQVGKNNPTGEELLLELLYGEGRGE